MMQVIFFEGYLALFLPFFRGCSGIFCNFLGNMKLNKINIHNFKCFEDVSIELHPRLNVLMGNNGTGKSSLLEAFRILIGSLYLGYDKYENKIAMPGIVKDDIRLRNIEGSLEPQIPAYVYAEGELSHHYMPENSQSICWKRAMETLGGSTTTRDAKDLQQASSKIQLSVREGLGQDIYYELLA